MTDREQILHALRTKIADGRPVIGGGAGTGLSAKCAEAAGLDFIVVYNSGRYRMAGHSSMAGRMRLCTRPANSGLMVRASCRRICVTLIAAGGSCRGCQAASAAAE